MQYKVMKHSFSRGLPNTCAYAPWVTRLSEM